MTIVSQIIDAGTSSGNEYYVSPADVAAGTRARAVDINTLDRAVDAAFDKLPGPVPMAAGTVNFAVDTGTTANTYQVAMLKTATVLVDGFEVVMRTTRTNTGPATLNVDGIGAIPVKRADGSPLLANDILANSPVCLRFVPATNTFVMNRGDSITRGEAEAMLALGAQPGAVPITSLGGGTLQPLQVVRLNAEGTALEGAAVAAGIDIAMTQAIALSF